MTVLLIEREGEEKWLKIPAPSASLATDAKPAAAPTRLWMIFVFARVSTPQLSIPPPAAQANGRSPLMHEVVMPEGHGMWESIAVVGSARLFVIRLFEIVTIAPPLKSAF